jgi:prevent-host-death family protein
MEVSMKTITPTELRSNIYKILDEVLSSGVPLEINKGGKLLRIVPVAKTNKLANLVSRPDIIIGNSDDLVDICWEKEVNLDLY